jgi:TonB family protein
VSLLAALLLAGAAAPSAVAPARVEDAAASWLVVTDGDDLPQGVAAWYRQLLGERLRSTGVAPESIAGGELVFRPEFSELTVTEGPLAGLWEFVDPLDARLPTRAVRTRFDGPEHYRVTVRVYCPPDDACAQVRREARAMRAPMHWSLRGTPAYEQWQTIVRDESCPGEAADMTPPRYPAAALRVCAFGIAQLRAFVNRCGEVRDVTVVSSTGNRDLDRAALAAAGNWRLPLEYLDVPDFDGVAIVPVNFQDPCAVPEAEGGD